MIKKLPLWAVVAGILLACAAGCMNGFVLVHHLQPASHHTGTTTSLSLAIARHDISDVLYFLSVILSFVCGAALSGMIVRDYHFKLGRRYGVCLFIETVVILAAMFVLDWYHALGVCLATFACGLQNAMVTTYSGAALRTSHVTGLYTDLGVQLGHLIAGLKVEKERVRVQSLLVAGFFMGGILCGFLIRPIGRYVMLIPAGISGSCGLAYFIYRKRNILIKQIAKMTTN